MRSIISVVIVFLALSVKAQTDPPLSTPRLRMYAYDALYQNSMKLVMIYSKHSGKYYQELAQAQFKLALRYWHEAVKYQQLTLGQNQPN